MKKFRFKSAFDSKGRNICIWVRGIRGGRDICWAKVYVDMEGGPFLTGADEFTPGKFRLYPIPEAVCQRHGLEGRHYTLPIACWDVVIPETALLGYEKWVRGLVSFMEEDTDWARNAEEDGEDWRNFPIIRPEDAIEEYWEFKNRLDPVEESEEGEDL